MAPGEESYRHGVEGMNAKAKQEVQEATSEMGKLHHKHRHILIDRVF